MSIAGVSTCGQLLGRPARRVPEIERHAGATAAFEEARDRRVAVGPVADEYHHARLLERVADLARGRSLPLR